MRTFDEKWEEVHTNHEWGKYPSEEIIRFVARNYYNKERGNIKLLDIGCGTGSNTWYIAREKFQAYGFDGSETAIRKAKNRMADEGVKVNLQVADAGAMPYEEEYFDGIIDSAMICANTVDGISNILSGCYKILKIGGKLLSSGLFARNMTGYGKGEKLEEHTYRNITVGSLSEIGTVHFFDKEEIYELWSKAGFKNIKIDYLERTNNGGADKVSYYIVESEK